MHVSGQHGMQKRQQLPLPAKISRTSAGVHFLKKGGENFGLEFPVLRGHRPKCLEKCPQCISGGPSLIVILS